MLPVSTLFEATPRLQEPSCLPESSLPGSVHRPVGVRVARLATEQNPGGKDLNDIQFLLGMLGFFGQ